MSRDLHKKLGTPLDYYCPHCKTEMTRDDARGHKCGEQPAQGEPRCETPSETDDKSPKFEQFEDWSQWTDALAKWVLDQVGKGKMSSGRLSCVFDVIEFRAKQLLQIKYLHSSDAGVEGISAEQPHDDLEPLNTQDFYELMHTYRHIPITRQKEVIAAFDEVRNWIRENYVPVKKWAELRKERDALIRTCQKTESALAECRNKTLGWISVNERFPRSEELPVLVWRGTTHRMEIGRPMPPFGKGTQDCWRPLPNPPVKGERQEPVDREEK